MTAIVAIDLHREGPELGGGDVLAGSSSQLIDVLSGSGVLISLRAEHCWSVAYYIHVVRISSGNMQIMLPQDGIDAHELAHLPLRFPILASDRVDVYARCSNKDVKRVRFYASIIDPEPKPPTHFVFGAIPRWGPP